MATLVLYEPSPGLAVLAKEDVERVEELVGRGVATVTAPALVADEVVRFIGE